MLRITQQSERQRHMQGVCMHSKCCRINKHCCFNACSCSIPATSNLTVANWETRSRSGHEACTALSKVSLHCTYPTSTGVSGCTYQSRPAVKLQLIEPSFAKLADAPYSCSAHDMTSYLLTTVEGTARWCYISARWHNWCSRSCCWYSR